VCVVGYAWVLYGWGRGEREEVEEEGDGDMYGDDNAGGEATFMAGRGVGEWCTAFMVLKACLYAWMRARQVPEMDWTAERKNTMRAWNENDDVCEVSGYSDVSTIIRYYNR
jgi:hypothetical protein